MFFESQRRAMTLFLSTYRATGFLCLCLALNILSLSVADPAGAQPVAHATTDPEIEMWFYPVSTANGIGSVRDRGATFSWYTPQPGFPDITGSGFDPIQRGTIVIATDTKASIPQLADPTRYRIDAVTVSLSMLGSIGSGAGAYDGTSDDHVAVGLGDDNDAGHPIEMWGVGFDGDYTTFGFNPASEPNPSYFHSGDRRWPISGGSFTGPYQIYPIDADGRDTSNSVSGGYSATEPDNSTDAFSPTPIAVGRTFNSQGEELAPGTLVGQGTKFEFAPDLSDPRIVSYVQNSLASGHLGFFFSSLHQPNGHDGDVFYPDFYLDNVAGGPNPLGNGPTINIEVTILPEDVNGDFDADGDVDGSDFLDWQTSIGTTVSPAGEGADGNGDGVVDGLDLIGWQNAFGETTSSVSSGSALPEPGAPALLASAALGLLAARLTRKVL
jgi:hypothetical protein